MPKIVFDEKGFTCECGMRNEYPGYVQEHWDVKLVYSCSCRRRFILYQGKVKMVRQSLTESPVSDAFGD